MAKSIVYSNNPLLLENTMGGNLDSGSKRNENFDFSYRQQNKFEEKMLKKHGVNMNEKYHVYD